MDTQMGNRVNEVAVPSKLKGAQDHLMSTVRDLEEAVSLLDKQVEYVLAPSQPMPESTKADTVDGQNCSECVEHTGVVTRNVRTQIDRIYDIISRCDA